LEIVSSHGNGAVEMPKYVEAQSETQSERNMYGTLSDLSQKIYQLRLYSQCHFPIKDSNSNVTHKVKYRRIRRFPKIIAHNILHYSNNEKNVYMRRFDTPDLVRTWKCRRNVIAKTWRNAKILAVKHVIYFHTSICC